MANIPLEDLTKALTVNDVKAAIYSVLEATGVSTTNWKPGAVVRTIIAAASIVIASLSALAALITRSGFISLSAGTWKTLVARYNYGVERQEATFAAGPGLLSNSSGFSYTFDPGDLTVKSTVSGKTFTNTSTSIVGPGASNVPCDFAADEAGGDSTAFVGEIDALVTPFLGVTVTNAVAWIGLDEETDDTLQTKCDEKLGALSPNGPADAYAHAARNAVRLDGSPIGITRVRVVPDGNLGVDVYCATAAGIVGGVSSNPATDLGAVHDAIQKNAVPIPITERTWSATAHVVDCAYRVWLYNTRGLTEAQISTAVSVALAKMIPAQPIGGNIVEPDPGKITLDLIKGTIIGATTAEGLPLGIFRVELDAPLADVVFTPNESPVIGTISAAAIVQVPPAQGSL